MRIASIKGREILDSRGNPTVEAEVLLENGFRGRASVPSGASTGTREACELRDHDPNRFAGRGVLKAVKHINEEINQCLYRFDITRQEDIDFRMCELDGTQAKSRLGANAMLAVSLACARAHAKAVQQPLFALLNEDGSNMCLPVPMMNILNGGAHANNNIDIQEFMIMPVGASDFKMALQMGTEIFYALKAELIRQNLSTAVGDEGGFAPDLQSNEHALDMLNTAVEMAGFRVGEEIVFALDVAASELWRDGYYHLDGKKLTSEALVGYYQDLISHYPIASIEDGLDERDWQGWQHFTSQLSEKIQLVGDDLFVTNPTILQKGIESEVANAVLIKLNQIGTLSETKKTMQLASQNDYRCIVSHRSGETEDTFIADLAVASGCGQIKTGSVCRTDRVAKYNQLLRINELMTLPYAGKNCLRK